MWWDEVERRGEVVAASRVQRRMLEEDVGGGCWRRMLEEDVDGFAWTLGAGPWSVACGL
jgi:hypothetical protein